MPQLFTIVPALAKPPVSHSCDLFRGRIRRNLRVDRALGRWVVLPPSRERNRREASLELMDVLEVRFAVGLSSTDDPTHSGRRAADIHTLREFSLPPGSDNRNRLLARAGGSLAGTSKHVAPHVEHREQIVTALGVSHSLPDRLRRRSRAFVSAIAR
jgi:hypothetical protein